MKDLLLASLACLLLGPTLAFPGDQGAPTLVEHRNAAGTFTLGTPADWTFESRPGRPEVTETAGDGLHVRIVRHDTELGLDSLHVECMTIRLAPPMAMSPQIEYEYDFRDGSLKGRRTLESEFVVHYDEPIEGQRDWLQRNLTVVGGGESLCVIGYTPLAVWKKQKAARNLLNSVIASVRF
jgi:hypothetical protein